MAVVYVISKNKEPLAPTNFCRARELLRKRKAVVHKIFPLIIRLKENKVCEKDFTIKIDPGASITGIAIVDEKNAYAFFELVHRGAVIKRKMDKRRNVRRSRRNRKTRYRAPRFLNRKRPEGWLAPSVKSRAENIINFVKKYQKFIPIKKAVIEAVSFDVAAMSEGKKKLRKKQYQQGPLFQTSLRDAVKAKTEGKCAYCGKNGTEIEHIIPRALGGTNSFKNLTFSCRRCNEIKGKLGLKAFSDLIHRDVTFLKQKPLPRNAAIIQSARNYTIKEISKLVEVKTGLGWETSFNRKESGLPKEHYFDAMLVGEYVHYKIRTKYVTEVKATGRGSRQMVLMDEYGFPRKIKGKEELAKPKSRTKNVCGYKTGDIVRVKGIIGKVTVRSSGQFDVNVGNVKISVSNRKCEKIQNGEGYEYKEKSVNYV